MPSTKGLRLPGGASLTRGRIDNLTDLVKQWGAKGLAWFKVKDGDAGLEVEGPVAKFMSADELAAVLAAMSAESGDILFFQSGDRDPVRTDSASAAFSSFSISLSKRAFLFASPKT